MAVLPPRPDLDQLRRRAKELLAAARAGESEARRLIEAVSPRPGLAAAQTALAREHGFPGWQALQVEVVRRQVLDGRDLGRLADLLARDTDLATAALYGWGDHPLGASPLGYVAMLRFDTSRHRWRSVTGTGALARALLAAGAPPDGDPDDRETPLITAASYGDADVAGVLVEAGADLERRSAPTAGGVPDATALVHAAVFGMTAVLDVLVAAGAQVPDAVIGAAAGQVDDWPWRDLPEPDRVLALVMAAGHQCLPVIDALVAVGTPVDAADPVWGRHPLRLAAENGRPDAVRSLLSHGADPRRPDTEGRTPLDLCRAGGARHEDDAGHRAVESLLAGATG